MYMYTYKLRSKLNLAQARLLMEQQYLWACHGISRKPGFLKSSCF